MNRIERLIKKKKLDVKHIRSVIKGTKWSGAQYYRYCVPAALITSGDKLNSCLECNLYPLCITRTYERFGEVLK